MPCSAEILHGLWLVPLKHKRCCHTKHEVDTIKTSVENHISYSYIFKLANIQFWSFTEDEMQARSWQMICKVTYTEYIRDKMDICVMYLRLETWIFCAQPSLAAGCSSNLINTASRAEKAETSVGVWDPKYIETLPKFIKQRVLNLEYTSDVLTYEIKCSVNGGLTWNIINHSLIFVGYKSLRQSSPRKNIQK